MSPIVFGTRNARRTDRVTNRLHRACEFGGDDRDVDLQQPRRRAPRSSERRGLGGRDAGSGSRGSQFFDVGGYLLQRGPAHEEEADHLVAAQRRLPARPKADQ